MNIPFLSDKIKKKIFGDEDELSIDEFKHRSTKLRIEGREWLPFGKDLEALGIVDIKTGKVRLKK